MFGFPLGGGLVNGRRGDRFLIDDRRGGRLLIDGRCGDRFLIDGAGVANGNT